MKMEIKDDKFYICYRFDKIRVYIGSYIKHYKFEDLIIFKNEFDTSINAYDCITNDLTDMDEIRDLIEQQQIFDKNIILYLLKIRFGIL